MRGTRTRIVGLLVVGLLLAFVPLWTAPAVAGSQVVVTPIADTTIYGGDGEINNSNGAGAHIIVGRTTDPVTSSPEDRRALIRFDLSGIPPGATITGVTLGLAQMMEPLGDIATPVVSLHRLLVAFGEGSTVNNDSLDVNDGTLAEPPDATWIHRITQSTATTGIAWSAGGGQAGVDYTATASASDSGGGLFTTTTIGTTTGMVADVQAWVDDSSSNFGWILIGDEGTAGSARGYGSSEFSTPSLRPQLTVTFESPPDLTVTKSDSKDPVLPDETFSYSITVDNSGASTAADVSVVDALPAGVTFVSASGTGWTCDETATDAEVTCTRSQLAGTTPAPMITITVTAPSAATILTNNVAVSTSSTESNTDNNSDSEDTTVIAANQAPEVDAGGPYSVDEGSSVTLAGTATDPDDDPLTIAWSVEPGVDVDPGGTCSLAPPETLTPEVSCTDDGSYTLTLTVDDGFNDPVSDTDTLTVDNVAPAIGPITAPAEPVAVGTEITASAAFGDPGTNDTHTAVWDWGDGNTSAGTVDQDTDTVTGTHTYGLPGVYTLSLTVTDDDGGSDTVTFEFVVVYDPEGGFVTGGGWIWSEPGFCTLDLLCHDAEGKASFGFVSKYRKGASVPSGHTQFQFNAGSLSFQSTEYEWLVISGPLAQYKGSGTINRAGDYGFLITAKDSAVTGGPASDSFRIKIWDKGTDEVVYDNGSDQAIGGGNIVIHK